MHSLSRLKCLGLHDDNDPEEPGQEYVKSIFDMDERQYLLDKNDLDNTHATTTGTNPLPHACDLDPEKLKLLQQ